MGDPDLPAEELEAFREALAALQQSRWSEVGLTPSLAFVDYYQALTATGTVLLVRFAMLAPLAAVYVTFVGTAEDLGELREPPPD